MTPRNLALPRDSLVLVTGANGFIASHIVDQLLQLGYNVRGTIRNEKPWLEEFFAKKYGASRFETAIVSSIEADGALDDVTEGVSGIVHVASDVSFRTDPATVISTAVNGLKNALTVAAKQPSVKRFVLTSSSASAISPVPNKEGVVIDSGTWNDEAVITAWNPQTPEAAKPLAIYAASKTEAEREAWKWLREHDHGFVFNSVLPNVNLGPILYPEISGSTMGITLKLLEGNPSAFVFMPPQFFIDVRDTAKLHVAALLDPSVHDERIFGFARSFNWVDVIGILRKQYPENKTFPDAPANEGRDLTEVKPRARAEALLRLFFGQDGWISLEQSLADGFKGLA